MSDETWKPIYEYEGLYEVSSYGGVRSVDRVIVRTRRGTSHCLQQKGKVLKPMKSWDYLAVELRGKAVKIHKLVANCFIPNPENKPQVNHIDGNKYNNNATNLEWCTHSENMQHALRTGLRVMPKGLRCNAKLSLAMIHRIKTLSEIEYSPNEIATIFDVSRETVYIHIRQLTRFKKIHKQHPITPRY